MTPEPGFCHTFCKLKNAPPTVKANPTAKGVFNSFPWVAMICWALPAGGVFAQNTASTGPVGMISYPAAAESDTLVSLPLHRVHSFRGGIASASGNVVTLAQASFAADAFNDRFYLLLESGTGEGRWFPIADTAAASVTIDPGTESTAGIFTAGTVVRIIPFWTIDSVFPNGRGVNASGNLLPVSRILLPDGAAAGIRLAPASSFFYYSGSDHGGEGWRKFGASPNVKFDDQLLRPGSSFMVRHDSGPGTIFENLGVVPSAAFSTRLGTIAPNLPQDHSLGLGIPVSVSLADSGLFQSGAFAGSAVPDVPADELHVFDFSIPAKNRVPSAVYYYYTGTQNGGPGWRLKGDVGTPRDLAMVFEPARGFVIRKAATALPSPTRWTVRPSYLNTP